MTENIVVFGAAGGVGQALCEQLVKRGALVFGTSRSQEKTTLLRERFSIQSQVCDARSPEQVSEIFEAASRELPVTGVVNLAGSLLLKPAHLTSMEEWRETIETNLTTAFCVVKEAVKGMREKGGSIVLVSSVAARFGMANHEAIAAAKAGVAGLALSAAATYASFGVRVNTVAPGLVETSLTEKLTSSEAMKKASIAMHPLRRLGTGADVASFIAWLLSPEQAWVTGQHFGVDGGLGSLRAR